MSGTTSALPERVYDAVSLLGFGPAIAEPLPSAEPGTIVLRYDGWSLLELRAKKPELMHAQDWYEKYPWASEKLPSGLYVLRLPIPDSNCKSFDEQKKLLREGEEPAHIVLAATALLSIRLAGLPNPLKGDWTRTGQQASGDARAGLYWVDGRLFVDDGWGSFRYVLVWLSAARGLPAKAEP